MQTDTYSNLLSLVKGLSGNTTLTTEETTLIGTFINRRIYNAYRRYAYWPRYLVLGEAREVDSDTVAATALTTSTSYTILTAGTTDWVALGSPDASVGTKFTMSTDTANATALTNGKRYKIKSLGTTNFTLIGAASNTVGLEFTATGAGTGTGTVYANVGTGTATLYYSVVPFSQSNKNDIDTFFRIYDQAPYVINSVDEFEFVLTSDGAKVINNADGLTSFYVDYKKEWGGDYNSTTNTNVPLEFFHYAAHGAFADFLRYDQQNEKAAAEEAYAESLLVLELENAMNQRNANRVAGRFRSHSTSQSRF
jgi:hypothetical protein